MKIPHIAKIAMASAALALGSFSAAQAVPVTWVDVQSPHEYLSSGETFTYTHNIINDGFTPSLDEVTSFDLWIDLYDDTWFGIPDFSGEMAQITLNNVTVGSSTSTFFNLILPDYYSFGSIAAAALAQLNEFGLLTVSVSSMYGDFVVGNSVLQAHGNGGAVAVPEPGTLGMLGLGLLGIALIARRRNRKIAAAKSID